MRTWELPTALEVSGKMRPIRADFRPVLDIMSAFNEPDFTKEEQWEVCLNILYKYPEEFRQVDIQEALEKAAWFLSMGEKNQQQKGSVQPPIKLMDWEQDSSILIPAINKSLGYEIRQKRFVHWWTFLAGYMSIQEGLFSEVLNIRIKKAKGKKLEKWEQEFLRENKELVLIKTKYTEEELAAQEHLKAELG